MLRESPRTLPHANASLSSITHACAMRSNKFELRMRVYDKKKRGNKKRGNEKRGRGKRATDGESERKQEKERESERNDKRKNKREEDITRDEDRSTRCTTISTGRNRNRSAVVVGIVVVANDDRAAAAN